MKNKYRKLKNYVTNNTVTVKRKATPNKFELSMYNILNNENIKYIREYQIVNTTKFFDAYLPEYNILLEFDGDYYHKDSLFECENKMQIKNFKNDRYKDKIAIMNGYTLIRIKQSDNIVSIKKLIDEKTNI